MKNEKRVLLLSLMLSSRLTGEIFYMVDLRSLLLVEMTETVIVYSESNGTYLSRKMHIILVNSSLRGTKH